MFVQNQIKRALSQPPAIAYVAGLLNDGGEFVHRTGLADFLCTSTTRVAARVVMAA